MPAISAWQALSASLCAPPSVRVTHNGERLRLSTPEQFCKAFGAASPFARLTLLNADGRRVCDVCVGFDEDAKESGWWAATASSAVALTLAFVNATPCREGTHARHLLQKIAEVVEAKARKRQDAKGVDVRVLPSFVARHCVIVGTFLVEDPRFTRSP